MSLPEGGSDDKKEQSGQNEKPENLFKMLDDLLSHTNSSRKLFLIFIASALFFSPVALVLGGVLLGHPSYNIRHLEGGFEENNTRAISTGMHLQLVSQNGSVIRELPFQQIPHPPSRFGFIFLGIKVFITISIIFAGILLFIAIKEYRFFSKWNKRFTKYKELQDKIDKELED